jgi:hypothetical protein
MLPVTCQIAKVNGAQCGSMAKGFVVSPGDSPMAIYKQATILCTRHGEAVQETMPDSQVVTIAELRDLMTDEEKASNRPQTSIHTGPTQEIPMHAVAEQSVVVMTVLPNAPVDVQTLAQKVNGHSTDMPRHAAPAAVEAPKAPERTPGPAGAPLSEVDQLKEQIRKLQEQVKAAEQAEKDRHAAEAHAKMVAADPFYLLSQASALRTSLFLQGGHAALAAVETLMRVGIVTVRHGALVVSKTENTVAPKAHDRELKALRSTGSRVQYSDDMVRQVHALKAQGLTDTQIEVRLHIGKGDGKAAWALRTKRVA